MNRMQYVCLAPLLPALLLTGCTLRGQASEAPASLAGKWVLMRSLGVTPPASFLTNLEIAADRVTIRSHWEEPKDGRYGLTLMGITVPEFVLDTTGREMAVQAGPFVLRHKSSWDGSKLVTRWETSEYMGSSFQGTWTRAISKDGQGLTLDIDATSSIGQTSRARLIFQRQ